MKVVIDFDNTFYTSNRDVDDALALMYLLGSEGVEVVGITSTFGNASVEEVDCCTLRLIEELGLQEVPYAKGAKENGDYLTPASHLLIELAKKYKGELIILALGSMSNLQGAYLLDSTFYQKVKQIVLMGGTTEPLMFAKQEMLELNFSCDPQATYNVLTKGQNVSIMTGNNCLDLLFTRADYEQAFLGNTSKIAQLIQKYSDPWFVDNELEYGIKGFYNWDSLAAAYLVDPDYFVDEWQDFTISINSLSKGSLIAEDFDPTSYSDSKPLRNVRLNTPHIKKSNKLRRELFDRWLQIKL
ncbi:nucleoside hydrolase [Facklamia sp. DSM 111018]|uniref:Nucleoside hydrolase n=1 Tax=Facklamia lactis TaxID=2749967 RepID=A0ABS0LRJ0_9LACT|nr:nucleoside hydrolase [Facklamia lactis]MBG9980267.1 nucleoside hydrolase [Facklamia lactis]MBG9986070.1 nucleoside hydrolase [Facklamia lactis]